MDIYEHINNFDKDELRKKAKSSEPFEYFYVDDFLKESFAEKVINAFPSYEQAKEIGREFGAVNEKKKIQVTDSSLFTDPIKTLNEILLSDQFVDILSYIYDIPGLKSDPNLIGGGIHETQEGGRLDVHVDFNYDEESKLYRRVNVLVYFNKDWKEEYGGILDLWDKDVKKCYAEILPIFNRVASFATSEISFHGVTPISAPEGTVRKSFAAYYYTSEAPDDWCGKKHSTIFKARPDEWMKKRIYMPAENVKKSSSEVVQKLKRVVKKILGM